MRLVLRGARVIDGTGSPGTTGDVTIVDGRIAAVGEADTSGSVEIVDLDGLTLALARDERAIDDDRAAGAELHDLGRVVRQVALRDDLREWADGVVASVRSIS